MGVASFTRAGVEKERGGCRSWGGNEGGMKEEVGRAMMGVTSRREREGVGALGKKEKNRC